MGTYSLLVCFSSIFICSHWLTCTHNWVSEETKAQYVCPCIDGTIEINRKSILRTLASCRWTDFFASQVIRRNCLRQFGVKLHNRAEVNWFSINDDLRDSIVRDYQSLNLRRVVKTKTTPKLQFIELPYR